MERIHYPAPFWIIRTLQKKQWRFRKGFYALTVSLSIKGRRLRAISQWRQTQGCKRNISRTVSILISITGMKRRAFR